MNIDFASHLNTLSAYAPTWGYALIFAFMTIESSFIPFPSEVVMVPAGFLAARGELSFGSPRLDFAAAVGVGVLGSLAGAYINYFLASKLGDSFLRRHGKYFFLTPARLDRCEDVFRRYGDLTTFACRLLPVIRQLISLPAGIARMPLGRFTIFTALGAGFWSAILVAIGYYIGNATTDMTYDQVLSCSKETLSRHYGWIILGIVCFCILYIALKRRVMQMPGGHPAEHFEHDGEEDD